MCVGSMTPPSGLVSTPRDSVCCVCGCVVLNSLVTGPPQTTWFSKARTTLVPLQAIEPSNAFSPLGSEAEVLTGRNTLSEGDVKGCPNMLFA